jgi:hypothetical protein
MELLIKNINYFGAVILYIKLLSKEESRGRGGQFSEKTELLKWQVTLIWRSHCSYEFCLYGKNQFQKIACTSIQLCLQLRIKVCFCKKEYYTWLMEKIS